MSELEVNVQTAKAKDDMNNVLTEIKTLREDVKENVGAGLNNLSSAAQRISAGIATELESFHTQVRLSVVVLTRPLTCISSTAHMRPSVENSRVYLTTLSSR